MRHLLPLLLLAACDAGSDIKDTGTTTDPVDTTDDLDAPDVAGTYDVEWEPTADCGSVAEPFDWVAGGLVITGEGSALTFDFDELSFAGAVDDAFAWDFAGDGTTQGGTAVTVEGSGTVIVNPSGNVLDGDLVVTWTEGDVRCEAAGVFVASQGGE